MSLASITLPNRHQERWRYVDFSCIRERAWITCDFPDIALLHHQINAYRLKAGEYVLIVIVNGHLIAELSDLHRLPKEVTATSFQASHHDDHALGSPFSELNLSTCHHGLSLLLPDDCVLDIPLHLLHLSFGREAYFTQTHHVINMGKESRLTILEEHISLDETAHVMNMVMDMTLNKHANLIYYKLQRNNREAIHIANTRIYQSENSHITLSQFSHGAHFFRDDVVISLRGKNTNAQLSGFYCLDRDKQYGDHHIDILHESSHSKSKMHYRGIIDHASKAVFNGRVKIHSFAHQSEAYQANHHLLLSHEAEAYAKPELEIDADEVQCKHGATAGNLDETALFYLQSRGMALHEARQCLLHAFANELIGNISHPAIQAHIREHVMS